MNTWNKDLLAGSFLIVLGVLLSWYCYAQYSLGTLARMGPGMFPFGLGLVLAVLGGVVVAQGKMRAGTIRIANMRGPFIVLISIAAFALIAVPLGIAPAIAALVFISSLAEGRFRPFETLLLCGALITFAYLIFGLLLDLPLTFFSVPSL